MSGILSALYQARAKWARDADIPVSTRLYKASQYATGLMAAGLWLRDVDTVGQGVRAVGRPRIQNHGRITLHDGVLLRSATFPVELYTGPGAEIVVGAGTVLNSGVSIASHGRVTVGARCHVAPLVFILDTAFHDVQDHGKPAEARPVVLEDDVWVGIKASIMPGVRIGRGAVVGAHAVVTRDVPPYALVAGVPARFIRDLRVPSSQPEAA